MSSSERFSVSGSMNVIITNLKHEQQKCIDKWCQWDQISYLDSPKNGNDTIEAKDPSQTEPSLEVIVRFGSNERKQLIQCSSNAAIKRTRSEMNKIENGQEYGIFAYKTEYCSLT